MRGAVLGQPPLAHRPQTSRASPAARPESSRHSQDQDNGDAYGQNHDGLRSSHASRARVSSLQDDEQFMSIFSIAGNGLGAVLMALAVPVAVLAVGIPFAMVIGFVLRMVGLD
jgi:hypothetical protein